MLVAPIAASDAVVDWSTWHYNVTQDANLECLAPWTFVSPAERLSIDALLLLASGGRAPDTLSLSLTEATVRVSAVPRFNCAAAGATSGALLSLLNSSAYARALADAILDARLPKESAQAIAYRSGRNIRIAWNRDAGNGARAEADAGLDTCTASNSIGTQSGHDVRALPAGWPGNTAGEGIAVIDATSCNAVQGTFLECQNASFSVDGRIFNLVGTLAELHMAPAE